MREQECRQRECKMAVSFCKVTAALQALTSPRNMEVKYQETPSCNRRFLSAAPSRMPSHREFLKSIVNLLLSVLKPFRKVFTNQKLLEYWKITSEVTDPNVFFFPSRKLRPRATADLKFTFPSALPNISLQYKLGMRNSQNSKTPQFQ